MIAALVAALLAGPAFFVWSAVHELSHYVAARCLRRLSSASFKLYPHMQDGHFVFASVSWTYDSYDQTLSPAEDALVSIAPRVPDLLAVVLAPMACLMPEPWIAAAWAVVVGAGLVDLAFGSIGTTSASDLQRFVRGGGHDVWVVRIVGWFLALSSASLTIGLLIAVRR
jgi:hypothetical protein